MKILICGSRSWVDWAVVEKLIRDKRAEAGAKGEGLTVIHGKAPNGADKVADRVALELGFVPGEDLIRVPAQWKRYGKGAGPVRNQQMLDLHQPDEVHAFRMDGKSNGTDDMIERAEAAGVDTYVWTPDANYA